MDWIDCFLILCFWPICGVVPFGVLMSSDDISLGQRLFLILLSGPIVWFAYLCVFFWGLLGRIK